MPILNHTGIVGCGRKIGYRMNDADKESLKQREQGYREISVRVWLKDGENFKVQPAFTFIGEQVCSNECGPSRAYLDLVLEGARGRELPETYLAEIIGTE